MKKWTFDSDFQVFMTVEEKKKIEAITAIPRPPPVEYRPPPPDVTFRSDAYVRNPVFRYSESSDRKLKTIF